MLKQVPRMCVSTLLICYLGSNAFMLETRVCRWVIGHPMECWDVQKAFLFFPEHLGKTSHPRDEQVPRGFSTTARAQAGPGILRSFGLGKLSKIIEFSQYC